MLLITDPEEFLNFLLEQLLHAKQLLQLRYGNLLKHGFTLSLKI